MRDKPPPGFSWDPVKYDTNLRLHGLRFEDAAEMLVGDENSHIYSTDWRGGELRENYLVRKGLVIFFVTVTIWGDDDDPIIRIISARPAERRRESDAYFTKSTR